MKKNYFWRGFLTAIICLLFMSTTASAKNLSSTEAGILYKYNNNGTTVSIKKYLGAESEVTIPDKIDGKKVTSIAEGAFGSNKTIKKVVMGKYINFVDYGAFNNCSNLETLVLNQGICVLDSYAFANTGLVSVDFPDTLQTINFCCFEGDTKLTTIKFAGDAPIGMQQKSFGEVLSTALPALKTVEIGKSATGFDGAAWKLSGLIPFMVTVEDRETATRKAVTLKAKDIDYTTSGNDITITSYNGTYPDIIIPNTIKGKRVVAIGAGAFSSTGTLRTVAFGANVREIGESAFSYCLNLQEVQFNYGLRHIQKAAFKSTRIEKIIIPSTVTVINCEAFNNVTTVDTMTFYGNAPLIGGDTFGINWWGNPMPKLTLMSIGNDATGYDGDYWAKRGLTDIVSRMSVKVGADSNDPKLLNTIDLNEK